MQGINLTITASLVALAILIFLLLFLGFKTLRDRKKLGENDEEYYYGGFIERGGADTEGGEDPDQVGGYAGPGVVNNDPNAEWI